MKVYTYENPFAITHASFWNEIKNYSHLCVSQTLVEGLKCKFGRKSFKYIDTIEGYIKQLYKPWADHTENEIEQFILLSEQIQHVQDKNLRTAMNFTKRELHEALRFLVELNIEPDSFDTEKLTKEQAELLRIYKNIHTTQKWNLIRGC